MIDTHCHLLPAVDDGPASERDAVQLARELVAVGVVAVVCTPHFSRRYRTPLELARDRTSALERGLAEAGVPLRLSLAAEISPAFAVSEPLDELRARSIDNRFLLVELEPDTPAAFLETVVERVVGESLGIVFAHPERCRSVREQPRLLDEARAAGSLAQVVAPSLSGRWGRSVATAAWRLLDAGVIDLLGSDSHRRGNAAGHLARAVGAIGHRYGAEVVAELTEQTPARLVAAAAEEV